MGRKLIIVEYIDLPDYIAQKNNGLAIDFGGSVIKVIYRPNDAKIGSSEPPIPTGFQRLRLATYNQSDLEAALIDIRDKCHVTMTDQPPVIMATGVGSSLYKERIAEVLKMKLKMVDEGSAFIKGFLTLCKEVPMSASLDQPHAKGTEEATKVIAVMTALYQEAKKHTAADFIPGTPEVGHKKEKLDPNLPISDQKTQMFPCLFIMMGSAFGILKIKADGSFECLDVYIRGGRSFLGLGHLLTNTKTYEELIELAEKGNDQNVLSYTSDLLKEKSADSDDAYAAMANMNVPVFSFGKTVGKSLDDFKREDLARALVMHFASDIAQVSHLEAIASDSRNVFFGGNFANSDVVREEITKALGLRKCTPGSFSLKEVNFHFMKHGGHLGAIGAFIMGSDSSI